MCYRGSFLKNMEFKEQYCRIDAQAYDIYSEGQRLSLGLTTNSGNITLP